MEVLPNSLLAYIQRTASIPCRSPGASRGEESSNCYILFHPENFTDLNFYVMYSYHIFLTNGSWAAPTLQSAEPTAPDGCIGHEE